MQVQVSPSQSMWDFIRYSTITNLGNYRQALLEQRKVFMIKVPRIKHNEEPMEAKNILAKKKKVYT